jgi:peroxiredoxin
MAQPTSLPNQEGKQVPDVTWPVRSGDDWKKVSSQQIFAGKKVVLFSLPGAFTPTCSSTHLPRYNQLASTFKKLGVDEVCCMSVNDTFVMNAWLADQEAGNIKVIPDGNGEFTAGMGMLVDKNEMVLAKEAGVIPC